MLHASRLPRDVVLQGSPRGSALRGSPRGKTFRGFKFHNRTRAAFTLVELLVAIGLFATIASIAVGGFASALRNQRQATGLLAANSNASLTIEQMAREIRTGYDFCTAVPCPLRTELTFTNARGEQITYQLADGGIERRATPAGGGIAAFARITGDNVNVAHLEFYLDGHLPADGRQPRVTIAIGIGSREPGLVGNIVHVQTTLSPRVPLDS